MANNIGEVKLIVTADYLNFRRNITIGSPISILKKGDIVTQTGKCWMEVIKGNIKGWVSFEFLDYLEESEIVEPNVITQIIPKGQIVGTDIVLKAMSQVGDPYIFGAEADPNDPNPKAFDCSELVEWVCNNLGIEPKMPDGSANQAEHCTKYGTEITIEQAVKTPGALLYHRTSGEDSWSIPGHIVISRGDGSSIEARGKAYGVGVFNVAGRNWTNGFLIPGVIY